MKSPYDGVIYIFGGRNIFAMNKLEVYSPIDNTFKIVSKESHTKVLPRLNHSMIPYKN